MNNITIDFFDPIAYLNTKGISFVNTTSNWIGLNCPWCGDSDKHLGINLENNACNCWKCGGHNIAKLVQLIEDCNWPIALSVMEQYQNYSKAGFLEKDTYIPPRQIEMPRDFSIIDNSRLIPPRVGSFLMKRGFAPSIIKTNKIYYSPGPVGKYAFRIAFPVYIHKQLVTFMTRDVTGRAKIPYISQPINKAVIPIKNTLYQYDTVQPNETIVIVEGPIDQWKLGVGSLATWGTGWTIQQVSLLRSLYPKKVYILYDNEEVAQQSAKRLSKAIWFCNVEVICLDGVNDPGDLSIEEGKKLMEELIK